MGLITKLFKNTGYLAFGNQVGNLFQFLFFIYFARVFGDTVVGQYSFAFSFTYICFLVLADLGLSGFMMREVARNRSGTREIFRRCLSLRLLFLMVFSMLTVLVVQIFSTSFSQDTLRIFLLLGLYHVFFSIADVFLSEFKGHDRMGLVALLSILVRFVIASVGMLLIYLNYDFLTVLLCFPIGSLVYLIACVAVSARSFGSFMLGFRNLRLRELLIEVWPFAFTIMFLEVFYHLDILMLRFLRDDQSVGIYSVANKIVLAVMAVMIFVHTALLPTFSRLFVESREKLLDISRRWVRYLIIFGLPVSVGLFAVADRLIILLYTEDYQDSASVLKILSWTIVLGFAAATYSVLLTAINRQKQKVVVVGICLGFNFILNLVLISVMDYTGAAYAKLAAEALHFLLMVYLISRYLARITFHRILIQAALSCTAMFFFIRMLNTQSLILVIPASALIYFLLLGIIGGYSREEIEFVKQRVFKLF